MITILLSTFALSSSIFADGKAVFDSKGCTACHGFGESKPTGPDLKGVKKRGASWLKKWLKDPEGMRKKDKTAKSIAAKYQAHMPKMDMTDKELNDLVKFLMTK